MKISNQFQNHISNNVNPANALQMQKGQSSSINFQTEIDRIIRKLSHSKHSSDKERCREMMNSAYSLIQDYSTH